MPNRITCITKPNRDSTHEHITHLGVTNINGYHRHPVEEIIADIESKKYSFYVLAGADKVYLEVQKAASGRKYVKTKPDHTKRDNLLSLLDCRL